MQVKLFRVIQDNKTEYFNYGDDVHYFKSLLINGFSDWEEHTLEEVITLRDWVSRHNNYILVEKPEESSFCKMAIDDQIEYENKQEENSRSGCKRTN